MDFPGYQLPEALRLLQQTVRRIVQEEIVPLEREMDPEAIDLDPDHWHRLAAMTRAAGLWAPAAPKEYGGGGLGMFAYTVLMEEMAQHRNGLYNPAYGIFGRYPPNVCYEGTPEQIEKYVIPTIREGKRVFFAVSEPSGGSDPAGAIQARAVRDGDHWILNGTKTWISGALQAEWGIVFVRTDPTKGRQGVSCFFVERDTPGLSVRPIPVIRPYYPAELVFQDCVVPHRNLLGKEGEGLEMALRLLTKNRFPYAAANIGVAVAALRMAIAYAKQRVTFGQPLSSRQAIQWMLADSEVEIRAARWLTWEGAWKVDRGEEHRHEASIAKLYSSEVLGRVVDRAVQIHGGYGVAKELPLERWYREARVRRIGEGPSEVQRMVIARNLLRDRVSL
ncbi:MAG: acyl-CoA dehydrogenase [Candidatus Tectimicrobiota bacterium]|nr:MAG: acyl-CoA dehydrogenase [Candidatus Tectomicrobia bacterium]